ncbi:hypothetical protein J6590_028029 [Homalodisca vitripennis]|nr:hypothetical protein J6590_091318 [Homalodisca vitripennis]KAG8337239.1 hypothetical protein J6590_028029 [Homalodisca vitripennis]
MVETWTWTKNDLSRLQAAEMRFLRGIEKTTRRDRIRNEITRERLKVVSLQETMEGRRIQWMGHVKRMGDNRMPRIALEKEEEEEDQEEDREEDGRTKCGKT